MGWSDCGVDDNGRPIGYSHKATCDSPKCDAVIHRGLAYACGGHHGAGSEFCDEYFCYKHLEYNFDAGAFTCVSCNKPDERVVIGIAIAHCRCNFDWPEELIGKHCPSCLQLIVRNLEEKE